MVKVRGACGVVKGRGWRKWVPHKHSYLSPKIKEERESKGREKITR
jgi:hypothetical protein